MKPVMVICGNVGTGIGKLIDIIFEANGNPPFLELRNPVAHKVVYKGVEFVAVFHEWQLNQYDWGAYIEIDNLGPHYNVCARFVQAHNIPKIGEEIKEWLKTLP